MKFKHYVILLAALLSASCATTSTKYDRQVMNPESISTVPTGEIAITATGNTGAALFGVIGALAESALRAGSAETVFRDALTEDEMLQTAISVIEEDITSKYGTINSISERTLPEAKFLDWFNNNERDIELSSTTENHLIIDFGIREIGLFSKIGSDSVYCTVGIRLVEASNGFVVSKGLGASGNISLGADIDKASDLDLQSKLKEAIKVATGKALLDLEL